MSRPFTDKRIQRLSDSKAGGKLSASHIQAIRRGKARSNERFIHTPFGDFVSYRSAAKVTGIPVKTIQYRCKSGNFKQWEALEKNVPRIRTPYGEFITYKEAAEKTGIQRQTIQYRCNSSESCWKRWEHIKGDPEKNELAEALKSMPVRRAGDRG